MYVYIYTYVCMYVCIRMYVYIARSGDSHAKARQQRRTEVMYTLGEKAKEFGSIRQHTSAYVSGEYGRAYVSIRQHTQHTSAHSAYVSILSAYGSIRQHHLWRRRRHADVCCRMLPYADICCCMLTYADAC